MGSPNRHRAAIAWALSVAFHVEALIFGAGLWTHQEAGERAVSARSERAPEAEIEVGLEHPVTESAAQARAPRTHASGGAVMPRPDSHRAGRGGEPTVDLPAINLAPRDDEATLTRVITSGHDQSQQVRRHSGDEQSSPEDDTVVSQPMILTFFAEGEGLLPSPSRHRERASGHTGEALAFRSSGSQGRDEALAGAAELALRPRGRRGGDGGAHGQGRFHHAESAPSTPMALRGRTSTPADAPGPQRDTTDAAQEVASRSPSLLSASTAGGESGGGRGGEAGDGRTGSGGEAGPGSRSRAQGSGDGQGAGFNPGDLYLRRARAKIQASWSTDAFPRQAILEGRGGMTIVAYTIAADGSVFDVRTVRPSGFPSFDAAMRAAVYRAAPFGPLPESLGTAVRRTHEFTVVNPAVR